MDENTRTGKYPEGTLNVDDLTGIGPFNKEEIVTITRSCVNRLGLQRNWDGLEQLQKHAYLTLTANTLAGKKVTGPIADLPGGNPEQISRFEKMVLAEFRLLTGKWDEDAFVRGFQPVYRTRGSGDITIGEVAHSNR
jgi:hypothetical protein